MKLFFLAIFILTASASLAQDSVKLSGKILHPLSDSVKVSYNDNVIAYYPKEFFTRLDKKGNFSLTFPVPHGIYIQAEITHGQRVAETMLKTGDSLFMSVDAARFDSSIHYSGKGSNEENFIALHTLDRGRMNQYTLKIRAAMNKDPADFLKTIGQEKKTEIEFLNKYKAGLPASFIKYWTAFYQYYNYFFMQQYPLIHEIIKERRYTDTIPQGNYSVIKEMAYSFNDSLLQVPSYLLYLTGVTDTKLKSAGYVYLGKDEDVIQQMQDSVNTLACKMLPDKSAEYFIAQNIYGRARYQDLETTGSQYDAFKKRWPESSFLPDLDKQIAMARKLAPRHPAPDFEIHTQDGKTMNLSDLKGKVVYLDFWAGWCKQCVGEMIGENKMKDLLKNKPVEFIYVSIDDDPVSDMGILSKFKITGVFTNVKGGWYSKEVQEYGVQALPAYYLIDEDGNFALQNPPHPQQSTELILAIEKLFR